MKKTIIASAILLFTQIAIFAQTPVVTPPTDAAQNSKIDGGRKGQRGRQSQMTAANRAVQYSSQLKTTLTLNDDQYQRVLAVNTECITRKDAMKGSGDGGAMKTGKGDIKAYRLGEFKKIFTPEQMTTFQNMNADNNGKGRHGKDNGDKKDGN